MTRLPALALLLTALLAPIAARPQTPAQPFKDPGGRYTLTIPAGWQQQMQGDVLSLTNGQSWMQVLTSTAPTAAEAANTQANNFHQAFTTFNILNRGASTVAGHDAWGMNFDATSTKGIRMSVLIISQSAGSNHFLTIVSATPTAQAGPINNDVMQTANSVHF